MAFLKLLLKEYPFKFISLIGLIIVMCIAKVFLIQGLSLLTNEGTNITISDILLFAGLTALIAFMQKYYLKTSPWVAFQAFTNLIKRVLAQIQELPLPALEKLEPKQLIRALGPELSNTAYYMGWVSGLVDSIFMLIVANIFFAAVGPALVIVSILSFLPMAIYINIYQKQRVSHLQLDRENAQKDVISLLWHMLDGFKEIKINARRRANIIQERDRRLEKAANFQSQHLQLLAGNQTDFAFLVIGAAFIIVLLMPYWGLLDHKDIFATLTLAFFLEQSILRVVFNFEGLINVNRSIKEVLAIEKKAREELKKQGSKILEEADTSENKLPLSIPLKKEITFRKLSFSYGESSNFGIGPINFKLKKGEIVFLVGENGSGKSTFLKTITGLYQKTGGQILVDGRIITNHKSQAYRELFAAVFSDFHLFSRLYGLEDSDPDRINNLIKLLNLTGKTHFDGTGFSNLKLSSGQKKRLALLTTFLENKAVYIFDEVAADQDPKQKEFFYLTVLSELKKVNKTILVVSHDQEYFHIADRLFKIENGQVAPLKVSKQVAS